MAAKTMTQIGVKHLLPSGERISASECICNKNITIRYECPRPECSNLTFITDEDKIKAECYECNDYFTICGGNITRTCVPCQELGYTVNNCSGDGTVNIYKDGQLVCEYYPYSEEPDSSDEDDGAEEDNEQEKSDLNKIDDDSEEESK